MNIVARQQQLDGWLAHFRDLWHPQPFRDSRPAWCEHHPALTAELLALPDDQAERLANDGAAALTLIARHVPGISGFASLAELPVRAGGDIPDQGSRWAWEIPGRKRRQIEAFATAAQSSGRPVLDWCGGKGHLGRLLALHWGVGATSLEIDPALCADGMALTRRAGADHGFVTADALAAGTVLHADQHAVALHACGDLHRNLVYRACAAGVGALDIAPCCYHRGVAEHYQPLTPLLATRLSRDDTRLAVTETVTASPRLARKRDREMAWKLGFDAWRREVTGDDRYQPFKSVPAAWFAGDFPAFMARLGERQGLLPGAGLSFDAFERRGWQRQREVMRLSVVRHAFRRPLEIWLVLDLAVFLECQGYRVSLASFCPRQITPRNLLLSARG